MGLDLNDPRLLLREDVLDDPRPFCDLLRSEAPVWRIPGQYTYLVSDPALIRDRTMLHRSSRPCPHSARCSTASRMQTAWGPPPTPPWT